MVRRSPRPISSGDASNYINLVDDGTDLSADGVTTDIQYNTNLVAQGQPVDVTNQNLAPDHAPAGAVPAVAVGFVVYGLQGHTHVVQLGLGQAVRCQRQPDHQPDGEL